MDLPLLPVGGRLQPRCNCLQSDLTGTGHPTLKKPRQGLDVWLAGIDADL
ncbi:uncharacterized protein METZ01_LOCUS404948, partial [marine metagenome]